MVQYGSQRRGGAKTTFRGMTTGAPTDAASMYEALLARSDVETDTDKGLFDRLWSNPITEGLSALIPGGGVARGIADQGLKARGLVEEGEDNPIMGPAAGAMGRLFDILSRGQFASAAAANQGFQFGPEADNEDTSIINQLLNIRDVGMEAITSPLAAGSQILDAISPVDLGGGDAASAAIRGVTGREKRSFTQNLEQEGVQNPVLQHGAGVAMDIALDPTTYLGLGATKAGSTSLALKDVLESGGGKALLEGTSALSPEAGRLSLNVAGVPLIKSERAYQLGKNIVDPVARTDIGTWFNKAFRQGSQFPDGLHDELRRIQSARVRELDVRVGEATKTLNAIPEADRQTLTFALDEGTDLTHMPADVRLPDGTQATSLEDVRQWIKGMHDRLYDAEEAFQKVSSPQGQLFGMQANKRDNYVYKIPKKGTKQIPKGDKRSIQDLINAGYEPETDILTNLVQRIGKSERELTEKEFHQHIYEGFGIEDAAVNKELRDKYDLVKYRDKWVPRQIEEARTYSEKLFSNDELASQFVRGLDNVQHNWKFLATAANPGHHIRNLMSDVLMNAQDGTSPLSSAYGKARRVLQDRRNLVMEDVLGVRPGQGVVPEVYKPGAVLKTTSIGKVPVPQDKVWQAYVEAGGKSGFQVTELHRTAEEIAGPNKWNRIKNKVGDAANAREDYARLSHFIDILDSKARKGKPLFENGNWTQAGRDAINEAGTRVRKWNLDYGALTPFERKYMRRMIPFYSFMRFNIPRQVELLATKPGFMALYPKGQNLLQGVFGTDEADDSLLPDWIRESAPFRLQKQAQEQKGPLGWLLNQFGVEPGQQAVFGGPGFFPIGDLERAQPLFSNNPVESGFNQVLQDLSPFAKIPIELGMNKSAYTGQPIGTGFDDYLKYAAGTLPAGRQAHGAITGEGGAGGFARYLTGLPIRGVSEGQMEGEFRRREDIINGVFNQELGEFTGQNPQLANIPEDERRRLFRLMQGLNTGG